MPDFALPFYGDERYGIRTHRLQLRRLTLYPDELISLVRGAIALHLCAARIHQKTPAHFRIVARKHCETIVFNCIDYLPLPEDDESSLMPLSTSSARFRTALV